MGVVRERLHDGSDPAVEEAIPGHYERALPAREPFRGLDPAIAASLIAFPEPL